MRPMRTLTRRLGRSGSVSASRHRQCTQQAQHADGDGVTDGVGTVEGVGVTGGVSVGGFSLHEAFWRRVIGVSDPRVVQFPLIGSGEVAP